MFTSCSVAGGVRSDMPCLINEYVMLCESTVWADDFQRRYMKTPFSTFVDYVQFMNR